MWTILSISKRFLPKIVAKLQLKKNKLKNLKMLLKIKINWSSVLKDVEENLIEKHFKNMQKHVNLSSCQKENNLTLKRKD